MLTAYTTPIARCLQRAGVKVILVGDTVGMVDIGFDSTRHVTIEHMQYHVGAVRRGAPDVHIIGDLPYLADRDSETALHSARLLLEAGADSVKLEGPRVEVIRNLVAHGIDVVGHTGLTPQTASTFKQVGRTEEDALRILAEAAAIAAAGAFSACHRTCARGTGGDYHCWGPGTDHRHWRRTFLRRSSLGDQRRNRAGGSMAAVLAAVCTRGRDCH